MRRGISPRKTQTVAPSLYLSLSLSSLSSFILLSRAHLIMTGTRLSAAAVLLVLLALANADPAPLTPYDCANIDIDGHKYDISAFKPKYE